MDPMPAIRPSSTALARTLCALVAFAAGVVGVLMLIVPGSTDRYFSWALAPAPLAALVGACYVASAVVFGWAAARPGWPGLRPLCLAVFGLTVPTLIATIHHRSVFDFGRWQAVLWLGLFIASPLVFGITLARHRRATRPLGPSVPSPARVVLGAMSAAYAAIAIAAFWSPRTVAAHGPIASGPMGIRFAGAWAAFLAILAAYAAVRPRWSESRTALLGLVAWPLAALGAALLHFDELRDGARAPYVAGLVVMAGLAGAVLIAGRASTTVRILGPERRVDALGVFPS
jgi:hypothetical protein